LALLRVLSLVLLLAATFVVPSSAAAATPRDARAVADQTGVNIHLWFLDTSYANYGAVKAALQDLGVKHVRDVCGPGDTGAMNAFQDRVADLGASGIKSSIVMGDEPFRPKYGLGSFDDCIARFKQQDRLRNALSQVENWNELDIKGDPNWAARLRDQQYWLYRHAKTDPHYGPALNVPVLGPSIGDNAKLCQLGDISANADQANVHPYTGGEPPYGDFWGYAGGYAGKVADARRCHVAGKPAGVTEIGYHNALGCAWPGNCSYMAPVSEEAQAIYTPRLILNALRHGVTRTYLYQLADYGTGNRDLYAEQSFGLFRSDWSRKPAGTALKNLLAIMADGAASPRSNLGYTLSGNGDEDGTGCQGGVQDLLFQKSDGAWYLALWQEETGRSWHTQSRSRCDAPVNNVTVSFDRSLSGQQFRPTQSASAVASFGSGTAFNVGVDDDVMILRLTGAAADPTVLSLEADAGAIHHTGGVIGDSSASGGRAVRLYDNGSGVYADYSTHEPTRTVRVRARSEQCESGARMRVWILPEGGQRRLVGERANVGSAYADYDFPDAAPAGRYRYWVEMLDDRYLGPSCDRNLVVDKVTLLR
jgi:hypothetical protein